MDLCEVHLVELLDQLFHQLEVLLHPAFFCFVFSFYLPYHQLRIAFDPKSYQFGFVLCFVVGGGELKPHSILEGFPFKSIDDNPDPSSFLN